LKIRRQQPSARTRIGAEVRCGVLVVGLSGSLFGGVGFYGTNNLLERRPALAQLFTEDGFVLSPGQPPVKGRVAIQKLYTGPGSSLSLRAFAYAINGDVAYIVGGYSSASGVPDEGKFTLTLRKRNRRWLIASDMDNENRRR